MQEDRKYSLQKGAAANSASGCQILHPTSVRVDWEQRYGKLTETLTKRQIWMFLAFLGWKRSENDGMWRLFGSQNQQIAFCGKAQDFKNDNHENWTFQTSCHFENRRQKEICLLTVSTIMPTSHCTRLDIAFDIENGSAPNMSHILTRPRTKLTKIQTQSICDSNNQLETMYLGKRGSAKVYRYYDKKKERIDNGHPEEVEDVNTKERLELELRPNKKSEKHLSVNNWKYYVLEMLNCFKLPKYNLISDPTKRAMISSLLMGNVKFNELSKHTAIKYRRKIRENKGFDNSYAKLFELTLEQNFDLINREIMEWENIDRKYLYRKIITPRLLPSIYVSENPKRDWEIAASDISNLFRYTAESKTREVQHPTYATSEILQSRIDERDREIERLKAEIKIMAFNNK